MLGRKSFIALFFISALLAACDTSYIMDGSYCPPPIIIEPEADTDINAAEDSWCLCGAQKNDEFADIEQIEEIYEFPSEEEEIPLCPNACPKNDPYCKNRRIPNVTAGSLPICPPKLRCPDRLPPQPCLQPIPSYYGDITQEELAQGIVLIHPYTRTQVLCYDRECESAVDCAQDFRAKGYVLITDIPQQAAKYDFLKPGAYPSRKWRNGEVHPRW